MTKLSFECLIEENNKKKQWVAALKLKEPSMRSKGENIKSKAVN